MTGTPLDLLSLVGAGSRLLGLGRTDTPAADDGFASALESARSGELDSGRVVVAGPGLGIDLTSDQLQRLAYATDLAEAQGAKSAAVLIDGLVVRVDVASRMATEHAPVDSAVMADVDVVVSAGEPARAQASGDDLLRRLSTTHAARTNG